MRVCKMGIPNVSFKAKFEILKQEEYSQFDCITATQKQRDKANDVRDFLWFAYSDENKSLLEKLPENDSVEVLLFDENKNGEVIISPFLYYHSNSLDRKKQIEFEESSVQSRFVNDNLTETYKSWIQSLCDYFKVEK